MDVSEPVVYAILLLHLEDPGASGATVSLHIFCVLNFRRLEIIPAEKPIQLWPIFLATDTFKTLQSPPL